MRDKSGLGDGDIRCAECDREVDEFTAIAEKWGYWSDGAGELMPFCPECAKREFAPDARAYGSSPPARHHDASSSGSCPSPIRDRLGELASYVWIEERELEAGGTSRA